jgi:hypothetical protein
MASRQVSPPAKGEPAHSSRTPAEPARRTAPPAGAERAVGNQAMLRAGVGRPIPRGERAWLEAGFGADLGSVRLHSGAEAAASARAIEARAFTAGEAIVLGDGAAAEGTPGFRHLLAHEVAHVLQGRLAGPGPWRLGARGDPAEREAEQAAGALLRGLRAPLPTPDVGPTIRRLAGEEPPVDKAALDAWLEDPPPMRRSFSLEGLFLRPVNGTVLNLPDAQSSATASVFKSLAGNAYSRALVARYEALSTSAIWSGDRRASGIRISASTTLAMIAFLESETKVPADISEEQRHLLTLGLAFDPVAGQIMDAVLYEVTVYANPTASQQDAWNIQFLARKPRVLRALALMWSRQTEAYAVAVAAWRIAQDYESAETARVAFAELIAQFAPYAEALVAIHSDPALQPMKAWKRIWPHGDEDSLPGLETIDEDRAVQFVTFAASQSRRFIASARHDPDARRSLLLGFDRLGNNLPYDSGDQHLRESPLTYNAAPLPMKLNSSPPVVGPLYAAATGAETIFWAELRFFDIAEALSAQFGGWSYRWELFKVPDDNPSKLGNLTVPEPAPSALDALAADLSNDFRYAREDLETMVDLSSMIEVLGPAGNGALSLVTLNLVMDMTGSFIHAAFSELLDPAYRFKVRLANPGLYVVKCVAAPDLDEATDAAQLRRAPGAAWTPIYAREPGKLAEMRVHLEQQQGVSLALRIAEIDAQLLDENLDDEARKQLLDERDALELQLGGDLIAILKAQEASLQATIDKRERGVNLDEVRERLKQIGQLIEMREARAASLGSKPVRLTAALATDKGDVVSLVIEAARQSKGEPVTWFVSDLTTPQSGQETGVSEGKGKLAKGEPDIDAILVALKTLLESDSGYGRGELAIWFPPEVTGKDAGSMRSLRIKTDEGGIVMRGLENFSLVVSIAAVVAAPFTAGSSLVLLMPAGAIGAIPSAYRLVHRGEMGTLRFDLQTAMEIVDVVTAAVGFGQYRAGLKAAANVGTRTGLRWSVVEGSLWIVGVGGDGLGMVLMGADLMQQIEATKDLPPGARAARIAEIIGNAMIQAGIHAGTHLASGKYLQGLDTSVADLNPVATQPVSATHTPPTGATTTVHAGTIPVDQAQTRPHGRTEAPEDLQAGLPRDLRATTPLDIDATLSGNSVRVEYAIDEATGRVKPGSIRIVASPNASAMDIALHAETARTLHAYADLLGTVQQGLQKLKKLVGETTVAEQGSPAWEAEMELAKLGGILRVRLEQLSALTVDDDARAFEIATDIENLRAQIFDAQAIVAGLTKADALGYVAADSPEERAKKNRTILLERSIEIVTFGESGITVHKPATDGDPLPGYFFSETKEGLRIRRLPTAGDSPELMLIEHKGKLFIVPRLPSDANIGGIAHLNNIRAQLDLYPPPRTGHFYVADDAGGWQLQRQAGFTGPPERIRKGEDDQPVRDEKGEIVYDTADSRPTFADRLRNAIITQPPPESRNQLLEAALDKAGIAATDAVRALVRRWGAALTELGAIGKDSPGRNLKTETELVALAVAALQRGMSSDGAYTEAGYANFRYVIRDAALAAMFGCDFEALTGFRDKGKPLPHTVRSPAEQRALYDRLYAAQADAQSKGELWSQYRDIRGRLGKEQGGFGDFTFLEIQVHSLRHDTETRIDGAIHIAHDLGDGLPLAGDHAVESKAGGSKSAEQEGRYSDHLSDNDGELVVVHGKKYRGLVYLYDNFEAAAAAVDRLNDAGRHPNIFVAYVDKQGAVTWLKRSPGK